MKKIQIGDLSSNAVLSHNDLSKLFGGRMDDSRRMTKIEGRHAQGSLSDYINGGSGGGGNNSGGGGSSNTTGCYGVEPGSKAGSLRLTFDSMCS